MTEHLSYDENYFKFAVKFCDIFIVEDLGGLKIAVVVLTI